MIIGLVGLVEKLEPTFLQLNCNGVIYGISMSLNATTTLRENLDSTKLVKILCTQIIREDAHLLFGFCDEIERELFERLIKINGVGPKVAMAILSTYTPYSFGQIIANKDIESLKKVPGIGAKGAGKIMVDVAGFFSGIIQDTDTKTIDSSQDMINQATLALQSLGFKPNDISRALKNLQADSVSNLVKLALKNLA